MDEQSVRSALQRVLNSEEFRRAERASAFLSYVVEKDLAGLTEHINGTTIAQDVFDRDTDFDPNTDPIVRVQAGRVRKMLEAYYAGEGEDAPVTIHIPVGGYVPAYEFRRDAEAVAPVPEVSAGQNTPSETPHRLHGLVEAPALVLGLLVIGLLNAGIVRSRAPVLTAELPDVGSQPRIFVSEFEYAGDPSLQGLLKKGFQIELIDSLARFKELFVYGADAPYDGTNRAGMGASSPQFAPSFFLSGSIEYIQRRLAVTSQLVDLSSSNVIWSKSYTFASAEPHHVSEMRSSIAADVAASLGQPYGVVQSQLDRAVAGVEEITFDDYVCLLRFYSYAREKSAVEHANVRACLEAAVTHSPHYSVGWAALSWMYGDERRYGFNPKAGALPPVQRALDAAKRAVAEDPHNAMAHEYLAEAFALNKNFVSAQHAYERALDLNPNDSDLLAGYGWNLIVVDNSAQGKSLVERAIKLNPGHPPWYHGGLAIYHYRNGSFTDAHTHALEYREENSALSLALLTAICVRTDREAEAATGWQEFNLTYPDNAANPGMLFQNWHFSRPMVGKLVADLKAAARYSLDTM